MATRSNQNNPEQKTKNGINNNDIEAGKDFNPVKELKARNSKRAQPDKSKTK